MGERIIWEADVECPHCGGTGLYQGMAERGGAAVVCYYCHGSGKLHVKHEYTAFTKRKDREGVKRVFKTAGGYGISDLDIITPEGKEIHFSRFGCSYEDWKKGVAPLAIRELHCPLQHFEQGTEEGEWLKDKGPCVKNLSIGGYIPDCSSKHRAECWEQCDKLSFFKNKR